MNKDEETALAVGRVFSFLFAVVFGFVGLCFLVNPGYVCLFFSFMCIVVFFLLPPRGNSKKAKLENALTDFLAQDEE